MNESFTEQQVYLGGHGGIWMSDDDAILMSPQSYREFVVAYNARILQAFGGGCLHTCGNTLHQADNLLATEGLRVFNNYSVLPGACPPGGRAVQRGYGVTAGRDVGRCTTPSFDARRRRLRGPRRSGGRRKLLGEVRANLLVLEEHERFLPAQARDLP